ncbi:NAD(P)H-dependent flavin oxidoreductase [Rugamonas sp. CCM 8940]|uniref:NAD(P)H-dependent flavin oxidoreductase n=1 Tax=Rugamonas sp. CCM 8940 TaxID=2765359 RepID=UPI0018F7992C|nr:nitronate monooxygenase family protein [Rugamonas sp. CCM 8940]MBJ7312234.1 nitronate monooxygenase [Rugamonas sp. CCM 8940]
MLLSVFERFKIKDRLLLPIVQGGMGVGVSAHRLAGTVARLGAMGTIASVDLRRHHADLMAATGRSRERALIDAANLTALEREIGQAKALAEGHGMVAVNVMRAVSQYPQLVRKACEAGADALVVGAGLPLDLPELTAEHPHVALIPVLSDARGIALLLKKWMRRQRLPDAIVIENPRYAAGHLGAPDRASVADPRYAFPRVLEETLALLRELGIERERLPLIVAGGLHRHAQVRDLIGQGASAVQLGTPFAVSTEGDADAGFKRVLLDAGPNDTVTFMSTAGLPARAVRTPWLMNYLDKEGKLQGKAKPKDCTVGFDCLLQCGWRDGLAKAGQFCIDTQLAFALKGDHKRGLFFRGSEALPFGKAMRPVRELVDYMLNGAAPGTATAPA